MYLVGARLLKSARFDLADISTTAFNLFCLGRIWNPGLAFPMYSTFRTLGFGRGRARRPRGIASKPGWGTDSPATWKKYSVRGARNRSGCRVAGVSDEPEGTLSACPRFAAGTAVEIPFGVRAEDFSAVDGSVEVRDEANGFCTIGYVGVGDVVMQRAFVDWSPAWRDFARGRRTL